MRIARIRIENFRGIKSGELLLPKYVVLAGDNNCGKSTVIEAIDLCLGPERLSRHPVIDEHDFYAGEYIGTERNPIEIKIEVVVAGLSEEQQRDFRNHVEWWNNENNTLIDAPPPENTDLPNVEAALRVGFTGKYVEEEDDFGGNTYFLSPTPEDGEFDTFKTSDNRSNGTDIVQFGNDLITGKNKGKKYNNVTVIKYPFRKAPLHHAHLKWHVIEACKRLRKSGKLGWSLAILVPSKQLMLIVSDYFSEEQTYSKGKLPSLRHDVAVEAHGPFLAATVIAKFLEGGPDKVSIAEEMIRSLRSHIRGRKGDKSPAQGELALLGALDGFVGTKKVAVKRKPHKLVVDECLRIAEQRLTLKFTGDPEHDWGQVQSLLDGSTSKEIKTIAEDAKYIRLLRKGARLRSKMSESFRRDGDYRRASRLLDDALLQEHFASSTRKLEGIQVMNIHKSKGKEFDEVIVYEGSFQRILWDGANEKQKAQALLALRVAVTRAMKKTLILTPVMEPCPFL